MRSKVSVIIPVYNTAQYLQRCLDSVCGQTLREIEVICINDASPDNAVEIIEGYMRRDDRIKLINFKKNQGVSAARNAGMALSAGDYLGFVDPDDYVDLDFFSKLYTETLSEQLDIVKGNMRIFRNDTLMSITNNDMIKKNKFYFLKAYTTAIYNNSFVRRFKIDFPKGLSRGQDLVFSTKAVICADKVKVVDGVFYNSSPGNMRLNEDMVTPYLQSCHLVIEYANESKISCDDYIIIYTEYFIRIYRLCIQISERKLDSLLYHMATESMISVYRKCKYKDVFFSNKSQTLYHLLSYGDVNGLKTYINNSHMAQLANLIRLRTPNQQFIK
jgi:glycosyltransferase involved in cell wall biosynthesis